MYSKLYSNLQKLNSTITKRLMYKVLLCSIFVSISAMPIILNASALGSVTNPDTWNNLANYYVITSNTTLPIITMGTQPPLSDPKGPYNGTEGASVSFDGSDSSDPDGNIVSYFWIFGDGGNGTGVNPTYTYTYIHNGTYVVTLEVTDNEGFKANNTTNAEIVDTKPVANFTGTPTTEMEPLDVAFTDSSTSHDGITSWSWDFNNDGKLDSTEQNPLHSYSAGTYTVNLTVCESDGDCDTKIRTDYINATNVKLAPFSDPNVNYTGAEGTAVSFDGSQSFDPDGNITSYFWNFGDGSSGVGVNPTHTYTQNRTYNVTLKVTDNDGLFAINTTNATIEDIEPVANFTGTPTTGINPLKVSFINSSFSYDGIVSWKWDFENNGTVGSTVPNPSYSYAAGTHSVALTVCESDGGCNTKIITNYINATNVKLAPSSDPNGPYTGAEGIAVFFNGSQSFDPDGNITSYFWNFGDGNNSTEINPTHYYIQNGTYRVTLNVTDNDGLSAINTTTVIIEKTLISIMFPTNGQDFATSSITVSGTALNNSTFRMVEVNVNNGSWKNASGTNQWNITVELSKGSNTIYARANYTTSNSNNTSITVTYTPDTNSGPGNSGGGGGGGGGGSGENNSNIDVNEKYDLPIYKDRMTTYSFKSMKNPILYVNITGNTNNDVITAMVEALKGTSSLVTSAAPGNVYMNVNVWIGTSGFATPRNIKEAIIRFRVDNSWIGSNEDIKLLRWDGSKWITLKTSEITKDDTFTYFEANTDSFSPFAITSFKETSALTGVLFSPEKTSIEKGEKLGGNKSKGNKPVSNKPDVLMNWFIISGIFVIFGLIIEVLKMKKK